MATEPIRRHRAGENPKGTPVQELVDAYFKSTARVDAQPAATA